MNRQTYYKLEGHKPIPCNFDDPDYMGIWKDEIRRVGLDEWMGIKISTVFLVINHNWGDGPPVLFETMIFGGPLDETIERYCTWEEAEEGHKRLVQKVHNIGFWKMLWWRILCIFGKKE